jgi:hypothetical protein
MSRGAEKRITVSSCAETIYLLTYLFLATSVLYVLLTFTARPSGWPLSLWEFARAKDAYAWPYYILWHPCFAILWSAFIGTATVQFCRLREWGRAALEVASWMALLVIAAAAFVPAAYSWRVRDVSEADLVALVLFAAGAVLCLLCLLTIRALRSPKVRTTTLDDADAGRTGDMHEKA